MLLSTYKKINGLFVQNRGYMSAAALRQHQVTSGQIKELLLSGELICFTRGYYWNANCGFERPVKHKYLEICMSDSDAVICLESAAYLHGIIKEEPEQIFFATPRDDRKKMIFNYPVRRFYMQNAGLDDEIAEMMIDGHRVRVYSVERTICDCIRMSGSSRNYFTDEIAEYSREIFRSKKQKERIRACAKELRAGKPVEEKMEELTGRAE